MSPANGCPLASGLAQVELLSGNLNDAATYALESAIGARDVGDLHQYGWASLSAQQAFELLGNYDRADSIHAELTEYFPPRPIINFFQRLSEAHLASTAARRGGIERAKEILRPIILDHLRDPNSVGFPDTVIIAAWIKMREGQWVDAVKIHAYITLVLEENGWMDYWNCRLDFAADVTELNNALPPDEFATASAEGRAMSRDEVLHLVLAN